MVIGTRNADVVGKEDEVEKEGDLTGITLTEEERASLETSDDDVKEEVKAPPEEVESLEDLRKRISSLEKRAKDAVASETRLYQESRRRETEWERERERLEGELDNLQSSVKSKEEDLGEEPDIIDDADAWRAWNDRRTQLMVERAVEGRVERIVGDKEKEREAVTRRNEEVSDYANYISTFYPDLVDRVPIEGISPELRDEIEKWKRFAETEGIRSVTKARKYYEAEHPDESALEARVLERLRKKRETLTREGRRVVSEPPLKGKELRASSWNDVAARVQKRLEQAGEIEI